MGRRGWIAVGATLVVVVVAAAVVAAIVYDSNRKQTLADGLTVGGIPVGGQTVASARRELTDKAVRPLHRTVRVRAAGHTYDLSAGEARLTVDVDSALQRAQAISRQGWLGARVWRSLTNGDVNQDVPIERRLDGAKVAAFARHVARAVDETAVSASVTPHADSLEVQGSRDGRHLDAKALARRVRRTLVDPQASVALHGHAEKVPPKTSLAALKRKYKSYILVDRHNHQLRLYQHLALNATYPIAVGRAGLETPAGLYDIQWKETNPSWHVPNSDWAGSLAGKTIPPGPDDPIKARWMAFNGGAGIHGIDPSEYGTIGHDASHGCVRMRIPDVIDVYAKSPVGTPVFVA